MHLQMIDMVLASPIAPRRSDSVKAGDVSKCRTHVRRPDRNTDLDLSTCSLAELVYGDEITSR